MLKHSCLSSCLHTSLGTCLATWSHTCSGTWTGTSRGTWTHSSRGTWTNAITKLAQKVQIHPSVDNVLRLVFGCSHLSTLFFFLLFWHLTTGNWWSCRWSIFILTKYYKLLISRFWWSISAHNHVQGVPKKHSKDLILNLNLWSVFFGDALYMIMSWDTSPESWY